MLTLEPFSEDQGRSAVHREDQPISFLTPYGFTHPLTRTHSFSSLPRGTCCYRSRPYLALGGIYRPIGAAFPNNPTRRQRLRGATGSNAAGLSPSLAPLSRNLGPRVIRLTWGRVEDFGSSRAFGRSGGDLAKQACPRPEGLGRNLRSKTSMVHGILQFTPMRGLVISGSYAYNPAKLGGGERITAESVGAKSAKIPAHRSDVSAFSGRSVSGYDNDPSAGSPTETLFDFSFL
ncbi:hypothetical protein Bca4012_102506 [Brassica carinata]